jgi:hypothetical protein
MPIMTKLIAIAVLAVSFAACGKSAEEQAREDVEKENAKHPPEPAADSPGQRRVAEAPDAKPDAAPMPEPTTPAEIDRARNQAMIDGRDKDVLKYCDLQKLDDKSNPQALLGCTLAACRIKDEDTARRYAKPLAKAYLDQAKRVCTQSSIAL